VVRAAKPEKIVLFGSAARGEMGPDRNATKFSVMPFPAAG
jgi:hypothetical protein